MNNCELCGKETTGSIGAAGIKWTRICQPCKNREDMIRTKRISYESEVYKKILEVV